MGKRFAGVFLSLMVVIGLVPSTAFATAGATALRVGSTGKSEPDMRTVTFGDDDLCNAVIAQLDQQGIEYAAGEASRTLTLDVTQVTSLDISNRYLSTLDGIGEFAYLTTLSIANNNLHNGDLSPLSTLVNLEDLDAHGCHLSSIGPIGCLTNLTRLDASRNELADSSSTSAGCFTEQMSRLTELTYLDLSHNLLRYTNGLGQLVKLEHLDLYDNAVRDFSGLADPQGLEEGALRLSASLKHLDLGENDERNYTAMTGLDVLSGFTNLTYLDFSENQTPAIMDHIDNLTSLTFLQLQKNGVGDVSNLKNLTNLKTLILRNNSLVNIDALFGLPNLEELNLAANSLCKNYTDAEGKTKYNASLAGAFDDEGNLVWSHLRKLDLSQNTNWGMRVAEETGKLFSLAQQGAIELNYRYDRVTPAAYASAAADLGGDGKNTKLENLPHAGEDGVMYVTYDDFGARCNGTYDDYIAMVNAHLFANDYQAKNPDAQVEVRATPGNAYHIFAPYNIDWYPIETDVDWQGATIVVHDEDIENKPARNNILFVIRTLDGGAAFDKRVNTTTANLTLSSTVNTSYKAGTKLPAELTSLFPGGYSRYYLELFNSDHPQHIRSGSVNANAGEAMYDGVIARADGTLEDDVQWDFEKLTKAIIIPIPERTGHIRNATVVHTGIRSKSEVSYYRGGGKPIYYYRNFQTQYMANIDISGITHRLGAPDDYTQPWDELSGSYYGIFYLQHSADVTFRDSTLFGPRFCDSARSAYDLCYGMNANITFRNVNASTGTSKDHRWSVISGHGARDVLYEGCTTNSAGTHQTVYNFTVRNCTLNSITLCGQGLALIENTSVETQYFVNLRSDYGTTWNGDLRIIDCTHRYNANNRPMLVYTSFDQKADGSIWNYGYETHFPNVYVENLKVDYALNNRDRSYCRMNGPYYIVFNSSSYDPAGAVPYSFVPASYWSENIVVNGVTFTNAEAQIERGSTPEVRLTASDQGSIGTGKAERDYLVTGVRVTSGSDDMTSHLFAGERLSLSKPTTVSLKATEGAVERYKLTRDGKSISSGTIGSSKSIELSEAGVYELQLTSQSNLYGWTGSRTLAFTMGIKGDVGNATVKASAGTYTGKAVKPSMTVKLDGKTLKQGTDFSVSYKNNTKVGTATATVTGIGSYRGTKTVSFSIGKASLSNVTIAQVSSKAYTGKAIKPTPKLTFNGKTLSSGTDYTLSYSKNTKVGTATITATGKNSFTGSKKATFKIIKANNPLKVKSKSPTIKASALKKRATTVAAKNAYSFTKKGAGTVTYARVAKGSNARLTVNKKNGTITVKKGTKRGTYKVKVKVTAKGNANYKSGSATVTVKVRVK